MNNKIEASDIRPGMLLTTAPLKNDRSYVGDVFRVLAVELPNLAVERVASSSSYSFGKGDKARYGFNTMEGREWFRVSAEYTAQLLGEPVQAMPVPVK